MTRDEVWKMVEEAFALVPYPGDNHIVPDPEGYEMDELLRDLRGKHWRDIPREVLRYHHDDAILLTPAARKFYLPAYIFAGLEGDWDFPGQCTLMLNDRKRAAEYRNYTPEQRAAIRAALPLLNGESESTRALIRDLWS